MSPSNTINDATHMRLNNAVRVCDRLLSLTICAPLADVFNRVCAQFSDAVSFTTANLLRFGESSISKPARKSVGTGAAAVTLARSMISSPLNFLVASVIRRRTKEKVVEPNARRIVASVADVVSGGGEAVCRLPSPTMGHYTALAVKEPAISFGSFLTQPLIAIAAFIYQASKPNRGVNGVRHDSLYQTFTAAE